MRKGFTLLELIVVIIIIGILATLGFAQYSTMIEKSRGAEARTVLGQFRTIAAGAYLDRQTTAGVNDLYVGAGTAAGMIPNACASTGAPSSMYYFSYTIAASGTTGIIATATRCTAASTGKSPTGTGGGTLVLTSMFNTGTDTWAGTGGY